MHNFELLSLQHEDTLQVHSAVYKDAQVHLWFDWYYYRLQFNCRLQVGWAFW